MVCRLAFKDKLSAIVSCVKFSLMLLDYNLVKIKITYGGRRYAGCRIEVIKVNK